LCFKIAYIPEKSSAGSSHTHTQAGCLCASQRFLTRGLLLSRAPACARPPAQRKRREVWTLNPESRITAFIRTLRDLIRALVKARGSPESVRVFWRKCVSVSNKQTTR